MLFFSFGIRWSISVFAPTRDTSPILIDSINLPDNVIAEDLETLYDLPLRQGVIWHDEHLIVENNNLAHCFMIMSNPHWTIEGFDHQVFMREIQQVHGNTTEELKSCIRSANINQLVGFATFFVKQELIFQFIGEVATREHARNQHMAFATNANEGIIDTWIIRARELLEQQ